VHKRAAGVLNALVPEAERRFKDAHKRILLITHAATAIALTRMLVGDREMPLRIACCSLTTLQRKEGHHDGENFGAWEAKGLGSGAYLKDGPLRDWGFEDIEIADGKVRCDDILCHG
jgi:transcription factor C subunit 7